MYLSSNSMVVVHRNNQSIFFLTQQGVSLTKSLSVEWVLYQPRMDSDSLVLGWYNLLYPESHAGVYKGGWVGKKFPGSKGIDWVEYICCTNADQWIFDPWIVSISDHSNKLILTSVMPTLYLWVFLKYLSIHRVTLMYSLASNRLIWWLTGVQDNIWYHRCHVESVISGHFTIWGLPFPPFLTDPCLTL